MTSPEIATLEGVQHQGGCIAVIPGAGSGPSASATALAASAPGAPDRSVGPSPMVPTATACARISGYSRRPAYRRDRRRGRRTSAWPAWRISFRARRSPVGAGADQERAVTVPSARRARPSQARRASRAGRSSPSPSTVGLSAGQAITTGDGADAEDAVIKLAQGGRAGARITVTEPPGCLYARARRFRAVASPLAAPPTPTTARGAGDGGAAHAGRGEPYAEARR